MTNTQETDKKFPLWGPWAGVAFVLLAITLLMTLHVGSRALVLTGALLAVIVAVKRWSITPEAKRITWLVIPAILAPALFGIYLYLRYDYLQSPSDPYQDSSISQYDDGSGINFDQAFDQAPAGAYDQQEDSSHEKLKLR